MLKKVPIMSIIFFPTKMPFLMFTNTYSAFRAKSEGLVNFSLLKQLECRLIGRAPGNPLARFWVTTTTSTRPAIASFYTVARICSR